MRIIKNKELKNKKLPPAVVLGVDISALAIVRSLGRRKIKVYAVGNNKRNYASLSRYADFVLCDNLNDEEKVISKLLEISEYFCQKAVLFCTSDLHVLHISKNRERLNQNYLFLIPEHDVIETLLDKRKFYAFGKANDFELPQTYFSNSATDVEIIIRKISFPCIIKPLYRTKYWSENVPTNKKVIKAESCDDVMRELNALNAMSQPLIFQEWVDGGDAQVYFCLAYFNRSSELLGMVAGKKLRQYPPLTGVTSLAKSIIMDELKISSENILKKCNCMGLCSIEYKYDLQKNEYRITEPTVGRVDLQEGVSIHSGIDLPYLAYQDAIGGVFKSKLDYSDNVTWINEPFELNSLIAAIKSGWCRSLTFFSLYRGKRRYALFAKDDMAPFLFFLKWFLKRSLNSLNNIISRKV